MFPCIDYSIYVYVYRMAWYSLLIGNMVLISEELLLFEYTINSLIMNNRSKILFNWKSHFPGYYRVACD